MNTNGLQFVTLAQRRIYPGFGMQRRSPSPFSAQDESIAKVNRFDEVIRNISNPARRQSLSSPEDKANTLNNAYRDLPDSIKPTKYPTYEEFMRSLGFHPSFEAPR